MTTQFKHGDWNAICDTCGFERKASEMRLTWDNLFVCADTCWEPRHPQDFVRGKIDKQRVPPHLSRLDDSDGFTETTLLANAKKGDTVIKVASVSGMAADTVISIDTNEGRQDASLVAEDQVTEDRFIEHVTTIDTLTGDEQLNSWYTKENLQATPTRFINPYKNFWQAEMDKNRWSGMYFDYGVDYFSGDFDHYFWVRIDKGDTSNKCDMLPWALQNVANDATTIDDAGGDLLYLRARRQSDGDIYLYLFEIAAGVSQFDGYYGAGGGLFGDRIYVHLKRKEAVGANGTLYAYLYSDSARTTLLDTLTLTLTAKNDFRYHFAPNTFDDSGTRWIGMEAGNYSGMDSRNITLSDEMPYDADAGKKVRILHDDRFLDDNDVTVESLG